MRIMAAALCLSAGAAEASPYAATLFGGVVVDNTWEEVLIPTDLEVRDSYLVGVALSARLARPVEGLELGVEGQVARHWGMQDHWEVNPLAVARWTRFPWSGTLDTGVAFGLGLSFASETPDLEVEQEGESQSTLAYWMIELDAGLPVEGWRVAARLHHRSTGFGTFGDDGGSNALVLGLRRAF